MSDKTGTLTQNDMVFKKLAIHNVGSYSVDDQPLLKHTLKKSYGKSEGPMEDVQLKMEECTKSGRKFTMPVRGKAFILRDFTTCLAVCHNVTPMLEDGKRTLQASSPDDIALVNIAESLGLGLEEKTLKEVAIRNCQGKRESFRILQNFPFTSTRKRMGIILQHSDSGRIVFFMKGADTVMKDYIP